MGATLSKPLLKKATVSTLIVTCISLYSTVAIPLASMYFYPDEKVQWNLIIKRLDITKPSYNKVILLVPALYISLFLYPDIIIIIIIIITDIYNAPCLSHSDTPSTDGPSSSFHLKDM